MKAVLLSICCALISTTCFGGRIEIISSKKNNKTGTIRVRAHARKKIRASSGDKEVVTVQEVNRITFSRW